jgi:hypothetical protein
MMGIALRLMVLVERGSAGSIWTISSNFSVAKFTIQPVCLVLIKKNNK